MTTRRMFGMLGVVLAGGLAAAQDPKAAPAGKARPGDPVPATFRAFLVTDNRFKGKENPQTKTAERDPKDRTGKIHCLVCENGLSPVAAVFVRADPKALGPDAGVVRLASRMNKLIPDFRGDKLAGFVLFLRVDGPPKAVAVPGAGPDAPPIELDAEYPDDERRDEYARDIADLAKAAEAPNVPFGLAPARGKVADAWGIGPDDEVTVVLYNRLKVANRWTFKADGPNAAQIDEIAAAVAEMITGKKGK